MTRTTIFAALAFSTVGLVGTVHAQQRTSDCIRGDYQRGDAKAIASGKASGYQIRGYAHYEMDGLAVRQICDETNVANYHKRFKDFSGGPAPAK